MTAPVGRGGGNGCESVTAACSMSGGKRSLLRFFSLAIFFFFLSRARSLRGFLHSGVNSAGQTIRALPSVQPIDDWLESFIIARVRLGLANEAWPHKL